MEDLKQLEELIHTLETTKKRARSARRKIDWEKEIAKAIHFNGGEATEREIVNILKIMLKADMQAIKKEVSAAFALNPKKTFRKYKDGRKYKYALTTKQQAI